MTLTKPQPLHLFFLVLEVEALSKSDLILPTFQGRITHICEGIATSTIIFLVDYLIGLFDNKYQICISPCFSKASDPQLSHFMMRK